jgi:anti-anti-sigma factor
MIPFDVKTTVANGLAVVTVHGDLDCATAPRLGAALEGLDPVGRTVRVDLSATDFMDCAGVRVLVVSLRRFRDVGGELVLDSPSRSVRRVLEVTGLLDVIPVAVSVD